ncbi:hypothetical protein [Streptomyces cucumeris]|uniref:hypothetical protein n=1 Tax=Streptomyces cucumeris TaxID=2962890 RepID=UPI0020C84ECB|nr:hypothetical protein [Streptomyces sp. NEAU-Y11]MCP9209970.1 hypothetical protein [Streptomyces sp. NEAU-Y11]
MSTRDRDLLGWLAMAAGISVTAHGEWSLALAAGYHPVVAAGVPVAIDAYAIRAMEVGREVFPAVLAMIASNAAAHLVQGGMLTVSPWLVVAVSAVAPLVLWRVHALRKARERSWASRSDIATTADGRGPEPAAEPIYVPPVPAEPAAEPIKPEPVPAAVEAAPGVPVLGPFVALAALERNQGGTSGGTDADQAKPHPDTGPDETPEPVGGTAGTEQGSGGSDEDAEEPAEDAEAGRFARHVDTARGWLATEPELTGTAIGKRLDASDSYGRRVRRAALAPV